MTSARLFPLPGIVFVALVGAGRRPFRREPEMNGGFMTKRLILIVAAGTLALTLSGCGGSDSEEGVPSQLAGTYVTTLEDDDLPANAPPELEAGRWELAIGELEGADGGSFLAIDHPTHGTLEEPGLTIDGDLLTLNEEECAQDTGYAFYDNEYSWTLEGSTLTLATVKNDCPDRVAETILTSKPWTKQP